MKQPLPVENLTQTHFSCTLRLSKSSQPHAYSKLNSQYLPWLVGHKSVSVTIHFQQNIFFSSQSLIVPGCINIATPLYMCYICYSYCCKQCFMFKSDNNCSLISLKFGSNFKFLFPKCGLLLGIQLSLLTFLAVAGTQ